MSAVRHRRRILVWGAAFLLIGVTVFVLALRPIVGGLLRSALNSGGARDVSFAVDEATPWHVGVNDLRFALDEKRFSARRVTASRDSWWQPRFASVNVEGARAELVVPSRAASASAALTPQLPRVDLPVEKISVDGVLSVRLGGDAAEEVTVRLAATQDDARRWGGEVRAELPGAQMQGHVEYEAETQSVSWRELHMKADLARVVQWSRQQGIWPENVPAMTGALEASVDGAFRDGDYLLRGAASLEDGQVAGRPFAWAGKFSATPREVTIDMAQASTPLAPWLEFLRAAALVPTDLKSLDGDLTASGKLRWREGKWGGEALLALRGGSASYGSPELRAEGIDADLQFTDLENLLSRPGQLAVHTVQSGKVRAENLRAEIAFGGSDKIAVNGATLDALGGKITAEPFVFSPSRKEIDTTLLVNGVAVEQVLALSDSVPAQASGRVDGRVPVRITDGAFSFGTGWLELKRGTYAEVQLHANGLLTGGAAPGTAAYATLQKIEAGLLRLRLSELRLDIRSPDAPPGRTASVRLAGAPVDPEVKAPVNLSINVNGPVEQLLNLGMDSRLRFGGTH